MKLNRLGGALALALFSCAPVMAQTMTGQADGSSVPINGAKLVDKAGVEKGTVGNPLVTTATSVGGTSTGASGSVTTANTYQVVFAANTARNACLIQNTSASTELVRYGSPTLVNQVPSGGSWSCNSPGYVERSQIELTSAVAASTFAAGSN